MNTEEIEEIKKTWEGPRANPTDSGAAILIRYFTKYPSNLDKFPFKDIPIDELNNSPRFRAHATRIVRVFEESVLSLDKEDCADELIRIWEEIAVSHFKKQISRKAYIELRECILEVMTEACNLNTEQAAAWAKLVDLVYDIVFKKVEKLQANK